MTPLPPAGPQRARRLARLRQGTALALALALPLHPAAAQQTSAELAPITVDAAAEDGTTSYAADSSGTATKTGGTVLETPFSLSVVTQKELRDRAPAQVEDAVGYSAGVTASIWGVDDRFDQFLIRGFDDGSTTIFRDGLNQKVLDFSGFKIDPYMIDRLDVLKGPAGVLYGENDAGGMVNILTKKPRREAATETFLTFGSDNLARTGLDSSGTLNDSGSLYYRLVAVAQDGENELKGSANDRLLLAPSVTWEIDPATRITVMAQWQKDRLTPNNFLPVAGEDYAASLGDLPSGFVHDQSDFNRFDTEQYSLGYEVEHQFAPNLTFRQKFRYAHQDTDYRQLYYNGMADDDTMSYAAFTVDETATQLRLDNQLQWDTSIGGAETQLLGGIDIGRDVIDGRNGYDGSYTIDIADPSYDFDVALPEIYQDQKQTIESQGIYAQGVTRFGNGLSLTYGARKAWVQNEVEDRLSGTTTTEDSDAFVKMLGASWRLNEAWAPYASYTESFTTNSGTDVDGNLYDPTRGKQYELGVKFAPGRGSLYTLALYDLTKEDVLTSDLANPGYSIQTGEVRHRGIELEARSALRPGLSLIASYSYIDAEITASNDGDAGNRPALVPENQASLWLDYDFGAANPASRLDGLSLGGGLRYVGETWGDNANTRKVDSYVIGDMAVRYAWDATALDLNVTNLFDKDYYATCDPSAGCILGEGRQLRLTLSKRF